MPDKIGVVAEKGGGAEDMVGMDMGQDHVADRPLGARPDRRSQVAAFLRAAARIDYGDRIIANHKADIGNGVVVCWRGFFVHPLVDKYSGGDLCYRQWRIGTTRRRRQHSTG